MLHKPSRISQHTILSQPAIGLVVFVAVLLGLFQGAAPKVEASDNWLVSTYTSFVNQATGLYYNPADVNVYYCATPSHVIQKVDSAGSVTVVAGNNVANTDNADGLTADLNTPTWIVYLPTADIFYFSQTDYHNIRTMAGTSPHAVTSVFGTYGTAGSTDTLCDTPQGMDVNVAETHIYFADKNYVIRSLQLSDYATARVTGTLGTSGMQDGFDKNSVLMNQIFGFKRTVSGTFLAVDQLNHNIREVNVASGAMLTVACNGNDGHVDGSACAGGVLSACATAVAECKEPYAAAMGTLGAIWYFTEYTEHTIRKVHNGDVTTIAGSVGVSGSADGIGTAVGRLNTPAVIETLGEYSLVVSQHSAGRMVYIHQPTRTATMSPLPTESNSFSRSGATPTTSVSFSVSESLSTYSIPATLSASRSAASQSLSVSYSFPTATPSVSFTLSPTVSLSTYSTPPTLSITFTHTYNVSFTKEPTMTHSFTVTYGSFTMTESETFSETLKETNTLTIPKTISISKSISRTVTLTPADTPTPSLSFSESLTDTDSLTKTVTITPPETPTVTHTLTHTATPTPSFSHSPTYSGTATESFYSPSPSYSKSLTFTKSLTASKSLSSTLTPSKSFTPSSSETQSLTATTTPSLSHSPTLSLSTTYTDSDSLSMTLSSTNSYSESETETSTMSTSYSVTLTPPPTPTTTISMSFTTSYTPSITTSNSMTLSASLSGSLSATMSETDSSSLTLSDSEPTLSQSGPTPTSTNPTPSASDTDSSTPTVTKSTSISQETPSPSSTATGTDSSTKTMSDSFSKHSPSFTASRTYSLSPTYTPTVSGGTESASTSFSRTDTITPAPTTTPSLTITRTLSGPTRSSTNPTPSASATFSPTSTTTNSLSSSVTKSPTPSLSITFPLTVTFPATPSLSFEPSDTLSFSESDTQTISISGATMSPTDSPAVTLSRSLSDSGDTQTISVTTTPTITPPPTATATITVTPPPTPSETTTVTLTVSQSYVPRNITPTATFSFDDSISFSNPTPSLEETETYLERLQTISLKPFIAEPYNDLTVNGAQNNAIDAAQEELSTPMLFIIIVASCVVFFLLILIIWFAIGRYRQKKQRRRRGLAAYYFDMALKKGKGKKIHLEEGGDHDAPPADEVDVGTNSDSDVVFDQDLDDIEILANDGDFDVEKHRDARRNSFVAFGGGQLMPMEDDDDDLELEDDDLVMNIKADADDDQPTAEFGGAPTGSSASASSTTIHPPLSSARRGTNGSNLVQLKSAMFDPNNARSDELLNSAVAERSTTAADRSTAADYSLAEDDMELELDWEAEEDPTPRGAGSSQTHVLAQRSPSLFADALTDPHSTIALSEDTTSNLGSSVAHSPPSSARSSRAGTLLLSPTNDTGLLSRTQSQLGRAPPAELARKTSIYRSKVDEEQNIGGTSSVNKDLAMQESMMDAGAMAALTAGRPTSQSKGRRKSVEKIGKTPKKNRQPSLELEPSDMAEFTASRPTSQSKGRRKSTTEKVKIEKRKASLFPTSSGGDPTMGVVEEDEFDLEFDLEDLDDTAGSRPTSHAKSQRAATPQQPTMGRSGRKSSPGQSFGVFQSSRPGTATEEKQPMRKRSAKTPVASPEILENSELSGLKRKQSHKSVVFGPGGTPNPQSGRGNVPRKGSVVGGGGVTGDDLDFSMSLNRPAGPAKLKMPDMSLNRKNLEPKPAPTDDFDFDDLDFDHPEEATTTSPTDNKKKVVEDDDDDDLVINLNGEDDFDFGA